MVNSAVEIVVFTKKHELMVRSWGTEFTKVFIPDFYLYNYSSSISIKGIKLSSPALSFCDLLHY